jgi:XTP/dITP diphosphohydrolase
LFQPIGYDSTFAELGAEIKNKISHRAKALVNMKEYLKTHLEQIK